MPISEDYTRLPNTISNIKITRIDDTHFTANTTLYNNNVDFNTFVIIQEYNGAYFGLHPCIADNISPGAYKIKVTKLPGSVNSTYNEAFQLGGNYTSTNQFLLDIPTGALLTEYLEIDVNISDKLIIANVPKVTLAYKDNSRITYEYPKVTRNNEVTIGTRLIASLMSASNMTTIKVYRKQ
jgi:hypothetical protein